MYYIHLLLKLHSLDPVLLLPIHRLTYSSSNIKVSANLRKIPRILGSWKPLLKLETTPIKLLRPPLPLGTGVDPFNFSFSMQDWLSQYKAVQTLVTSSLSFTEMCFIPT